jgi:hypothetical protein
VSTLSRLAAVAAAAFLAVTTAGPRANAQPQPKTDTYVFRLEKFHINETRAFQNDTDTVTLALNVGARHYETQVRHMGDVNDGDHAVDLKFEPVTADTPSTPVVLNYLILNAGHADTAKLEAAVKSAADGLLGEATKAPLPIWAKLGVMVGKELTDFLLGLAFEDHDGWVAGDQIVVDGATLERWTAATGTHRETREYRGANSPTGGKSSSKYTVTWSVNRIPPKRTRLSSGFLIQSAFGNRGNFEMVIPWAGGLGHLSRYNDVVPAPWGGPYPVPGLPNGLARADSVALIQSNYSRLGNGPGNLEAVVRVGDRLAAYFLEDGAPIGQPRPHWKGPFYFADGLAVAGNPALIQSRFGDRGNFELLVPLTNGGLAHLWRDNDAESGPVWGGPYELPRAPQGAGTVEAVALIQSTFSALGGGPGNLEVVARIGDRLAFYVLPDGPGRNGEDRRWSGPEFFAPGVSVAGTPALIQSRFGNPGNFELLVPLANGGVAHFFRNNDDPKMPWGGPYELPKLPDGGGKVESVSVIQSNFSETGNHYSSLNGGRGNLEAVVRVGNRFFGYYFPDQPGPKGESSHWRGPYPIN